MGLGIEFGSALRPVPLKMYMTKNSIDHGYFGL